MFPEWLFSTFATATLHFFILTCNNWFFGYLTAEEKQAVKHRRYHLWYDKLVIKQLLHSEYTEQRQHSEEVLFLATFWFLLNIQHVADRTWTWTLEMLRDKKVNANISWQSFRLVCLWWAESKLRMRSGGLCVVRCATYYIPCILHKLKAQSYI